MKETYSSNSQAIYTKALETAAEEVAFYQTKLQKSKELFALCEKLLAGLGESSPKVISPKSRAEKNQKIINAIKDRGWFSIAEIANEIGLSYGQIHCWLVYHKDQVEFKLKENHRIHKYYRLLSDEPKPEVKKIPEKIKKAMLGKCLPISEIARRAGYSINGIKQWINKNQRELEVNISTDIRPGWKVRTYKLKA